ncbi:GCN5-related N-acetyltransferase [Paenibacillus curdlanolyticus YK9]|uniref:GCN5-related N-acetyltransferase n=1 Tax=Paenibacillus curdlanolyticus YK9 TaxID=717606 RepID=E0IAA0_9BACL|nr:GNAT family N-acetyltransferase [Paenibacillus curdlanolyticus]EFM10677.1 GCN5-related N-acetyltransferase [Paenibacillus curdlanolyticus YK9]
MGYEIIERPPTVDEHKSLWDAVGWGKLDTEMSEQSLANSVYGAVVVCDGKVVGMGRIVGDGAMYFYIQDVAVLPEHQKQGIGKMIVDQLLAFIKKRKYKNGIAFVGLFASHGNDKFYEQYGFKDHSPEMTGMFTVFEE